MVTFSASTQVFGQDTDEEVEEETIDIDDQIIKDKVQERLNEAVLGDDAADDDEGSTLNWYSAFGTVSNITNSSLDVSDADQTKYTVNFTKDTDLSFLSEKNVAKSIDPDEIEEEWFAIAMGPYEPDDQSTISALRISFSENPPISVERKILLGKVGEIDSQAMTLINGDTIDITIPNLINLVIKGLNSSELNDVNPDDKAVVVVEISQVESEEEAEVQITYTLKALFVVPGINNSLTEDDSTDSSPTQSAEETDSTESN